MTFRLKDKNLQVQLDALSDGDFSKRLQHANHDDGMIFVEFGEKLESSGFDLHRFNLAFFDDDVEEIHRYNPNAWNVYPDVQPPVGVWMRCEYKAYDGEPSRIAARYAEYGDFGDCEWQDWRGHPVEVDRFRPWDDPDGEEDEE